MANPRLRKELVEGMKALETIGVVNGATMREFAKDLLEPPPLYNPRHIRALREKANVSQAVFAALLNVSLSTLQSWEQGKKKPSALARKLLQIVEDKGLSVLVPEG